MNQEETGYGYQEFPKWKYHPTLGGRIVQNAEEEKALGNGWYNNRNEFPQPPTPSRITTILDEVVKPWWTKWQWIVTGLAAITGLVVAIRSLLRGH